MARLGRDRSMSRCAHCFRHRHVLSLKVKVRRHGSIGGGVYIRHEHCDEQWDYRPNDFTDTGFGNYARNKQTMDNSVFPD